MSASGQSPLPDRICLPQRFDAAALAADLASLQAHDWTAHFVRANYSGSWDVLPLRAPYGETHPIRMIYPDPMATRYIDTPFLAQAPAFQAVIAAFACEARAARLMRLAAGSSIHRHCDPDLDAAQGMARIHVPIATHDDVVFLLNDRHVAMAVGSSWYLRLSDPHEVHNRGPTDRVHLVIDFVVNEWLTALLIASAPP